SLLRHPDPCDIWAYGSCCELHGRRSGRMCSLGVLLSTRCAAGTGRSGNDAASPSSMATRPSGKADSIRIPGLAQTWLTNGYTVGKDHFYDDGNADIDLCARPAVLADAGASSD